MNPLLSTALKYRERGFSVIPIGKEKKPLIKWEEFQKRCASKEEIEKWWKQMPFANVGIVTGIISGLAVVDIDNSEQAKPILDTLIPDSLEIPTTQTPRGGQHLYFKCTDPKITNNAGAIPGSDLRANGGYIVAPPSVNGNGKGYEWLKGLSIDEVEAPALPASYVLFLKKALNKNIYNNSFLYNSYIEEENPSCRQVSSKSSSVVNLFTEGRRDSDLFHVANCLIKGRMPETEVMQVLEKLALSCNPPFDLKELPAKIQSAKKRNENRERNLTAEVEEYIMSSSGVILSSECRQCLHLSSRDEIKNLSTILRRFCEGENRLLERYGDKNGQFRIIEKNCDVIDFKSALDAEFEIKYPFGIESYVKTLPKNIIVVAGAPNAGKTAFLLNVAEMNQSKQDVNYFSSEMGAIELKDRLSKFDKPLDSWHFTAFERSENFADVIKPDSINIIDFLEMHEDFWKVGLFIKQIYDKLNKGIAVIALQKNPGVNYGLGGARSIEKARLYLTLDNHKIRIEKAKNWVNSSVNPNGLEAEYKLVNGCNFIIEKSWRKS